MEVVAEVRDYVVEVCDDVLQVGYNVMLLWCGYLIDWSRHTEYRMA